MQAQDLGKDFTDRDQRLLGEALRQYRGELRAVDAKMASSGRLKSGAHLAARVEVLHNRTRALTDQCFGDVERLPGRTSVHRYVWADPVAEQLREFVSQAEVDVYRFDAPPGATGREEGQMHNRTLVVDAS